MKLFSNLRDLVMLLVLACASLAWIPAAQACTAQGCVFAGPRLASVDTARGELTNALLGGLTNSSITVTAADWSTLATGEVSILGLVNAVEASVGPGNPASLSTIFNAAASATIAPNQAGVQGALGRVATGFNAPIGNVLLSDILKITGAPGNSSINALDLVTGVVQLFNFKNVATTPSPVTVDLTKVTGLGLGSLSIAAQVSEPPIFICGPTGTAFHTAAIRLKYNLGLGTVGVNASLLNGLLGLTSGAMITLTQGSLYVEVARAEGNITGTVNATDNKYSVNVTPGLVDLYLGQISDTVFFNRSHTLVASDFSAANIGTLKITIALVGTLTVGIELKGNGRGQSPSATRLDFTGPYSQTLTAYTHASFLANLLSTFTNSLQLTVNPSIAGAVGTAILSGIKPLVVNALAPVLATVLDLAVDPLLELVGVRLGEVDVTATGVYQLCSVAGVTYNDANHSARQELAEAGTGLTLYAKLIATATPNVVSQVATINSGTGAFAFSNVLPANYSVIIDTNTTTSDVVAGVTAGWIGTEVPTLSRSITLTTLDISGQSFGIYNGSKVSGVVFKDTGSGSGTANNVIRDGTEASLAGASIKITDAAGTITYDTTTSMDNGAYTLWVPAAAGAVSLKITELNVATAQVSIGAAVGNSSGTYDRSSDTVTFTHVIGSVYSGVNFADVPANQFDTDGRQTILPATVALYSHAFTAGTAGTVTFSTQAQALSGWSNLVFHDSNCNGAVDIGESQFSSLAVVADQKVCVLIKVFAADTAVFGAQYPVTVSAAVALANCALNDLLSRNDLTTVGTPANTGLHLLKVVDRSTAKAGDVLTYTITYTNHGVGPLSALQINDSTPGYTLFTDATCGSQPAGIISCSLTSQPSAGAAGSIQWTLSGNLAAGASGTVTFRVVLQ